MKEKFAFLKSIRFWKLFIVAMAQFLNFQGIIDTSIANGLSILLLGDITIRTIDRSAEKIGNGK